MAEWEQQVYLWGIESMIQNPTSEDHVYGPQVGKTPVVVAMD